MTSLKFLFLFLSCSHAYYSDIPAVAGFLLLQVVSVVTSVFDVPSVNGILSHEVVTAVAGALVVAAWQPCCCRLLYFVAGITTVADIPGLTDVFGIPVIVNIPPAPRVPSVVMPMLFLRVLLVSMLLSSNGKTSIVHYRTLSFFAFRL